jgi:hypothetical protein
VTEVKAIACELPAVRAVPLGRWSLAELRQEVITTGLVDQVSVSTLWRWLTEDALKPWRPRSWIFPRDPGFAAKAAVVLDLYARRFQGQGLGPGEFVISADEKTSIQAAAAAIPPCRRGWPERCGWSTNTSAAVRWRIWRPGTSIRPGCLAAAKLRSASPRSGGWSTR